MDALIPLKQNKKGKTWLSLFKMCPTRTTVAIQKWNHLWAIITNNCHNCLFCQTSVMLYKHLLCYGLHNCNTKYKCDPFFYFFTLVCFMAKMTSSFGSRIHWAIHISAHIWTLFFLFSNGPTSQVCNQCLIDHCVSFHPQAAVGICLSKATFDQLEDFVVGYGKIDSSGVLTEIN